MAPGCCCPWEWLEKGNAFSLWYLGINKEFPYSECGRGDGTGAQKKPRSHLPGVWDRFSCVWGDLHKVLSAHLGGRCIRLERTADGDWSPGNGDGGRSVACRKKRHHTALRKSQLCRTLCQGHVGLVMSWHGPARALPALRLWLLDLKKEQEGECGDLVSFSNHIGR